MQNLKLLNSPVKKVVWKIFFKNTSTVGATKIKDIQPPVCNCTIK